MNAPDMLAPLTELKSHELADDFARPGHGRHCELHADLRQPERGNEQDADAGGVGERRQQRQQLHTFHQNSQ